MSLIASKADHGTGPHDYPLGRLESARQDGEQAARRALQRVEAEDVRRALLHYPAELRRAILDLVGLPDLRRISRRAAGTVLARLRGGRYSPQLRSRLTYPLTLGYHNCDDLTADECIGLLGGDEEVLHRAGCLAFNLYVQAAVPRSLTRWALAEVVAHDAELAPVALAQLLGMADELDEETAAWVHGAWAALRAREPRLPERPRLPGSAPADPAEPPPPAPEPLESSMTTPPPPRQRPSDDDSRDDGARRLLDDAEAAFAEAVPAADAVRDAVAARRRPGDADLQRLTEAVLAFDRLRAALAGDADVPSEATLHDVRAVLDERAAAQDDAALIARLAAVTGPPAVEEVLAEIRAAAARGEPPGLAVLARLIDAAAGDADVDEVSALSGHAHEQLPGGWSKAVTYAALGQLSFAEETAGEHDSAEDDDTPVSEEDAAAAPPPDEPPPPPRELDDLDALLIADGEQRAADDEPAAAPADAPPPEAKDEARPQAPAPSAEQTDTPAEDDSAAPEPSTTAPATAPAAPERRQEPEAEAAALRSGRPALAGWVRLACGAPEAQAKVRWAAALARETNAAGGRLASAYVELVRGLDAGALDDDPAGRLLAWASAIRAGIVRPSPESAELLRRHAPAVAAHAGPAALGDSFLRAANRGDYLVPGVSNELRDAQRAEEQRRLRSAQARQLLAEGPRKKIKYQLATEVWKHLLQDDGEVGRLLALAAADAEDRAGRAGAEVERLRAAGAVERLIDDTTAELRGGRSKRRIEAAARRRLAELIDEALDIVHEWSRAADEVLAIRDAKPEHTGMRQRLAQLRDEAFEVRDDCLAALAELERDAADPVLGAAACTAAALLEDTLRLLSGDPLGDEPRTPDQVLGQDLLLAPGVALHPESFRPRGVPALPDLLPLCDGGEPDWTAAFEARARRDDHVGTEAIVRALRTVDPGLAADLEQRRRTLREQARKEIGDLRDKIVDKLAQMRRDGQLDEAAATRLQTRLRPLHDRGRDDFDRLRAAAESVAAEADEIAARQVADVRADLEAHLDEPSVAAAADRIREYLDRGDLTTARESLVQARQGRELPEPSRERGHLARFFPAFPDAFEELGPARGEQVSTAITMLGDAMEHGGRLADDRLRRLLSGAGLDLAGLRRSGVSREGLRSWHRIARGPKAAGNLLTAIEPVLRLIGLEAAARPGAAERARTWFELTGVHWRGPALLPQFGTGMSPSGDTLRLLLVWRRPRPQEIVEWFKGEPADQTVLVWYFGTLSAADRQRLVRAARRRPHPVAVLDDAAVGYLACLPECDWTDTVEVLAPFTSLNPFIPTGNVPEEMFYGRQEQLRQVIDRKGGSFVYGGRQLGKSALLHAARRQVDRDPNRAVIFKSISAVGRTDPADAVWARLRRPLADVGVLSPADTGGDAEEIREAIRAWLAADPRRQLLILLDEADEFLNRDADSARFVNVNALRDLMSETDRRVKVVFAGLHQTARFKSLPNQPLAHFGEPISIGPLQPQDAFDLLTKPLATLGFRLPETLAARVIAEANNAPALIQLFADALLKHLQRRTTDKHPLPYTVTRDDVDAVRKDARLADGFRERFDWTINLDQRYKVIAYVVAFRALTEAADATIPAGDLFGECRQWWPQGFAQCTRDEFQGLLDESVELGILLAEDGGYRLRTPYILDLLGGEEQVQEALDRAEEFELPDSFDVHSYRSAYAGGPERSERSPLTSGQVSRLLRKANLVHVLAGSRALRLERVPDALRAEEDHNPHVKVHVLQGGGGFGALVAEARAHPGHTLIVMDLHGCTAGQAAARIREACETVTRHHSSREGTLGVVCTAPPALAPLWLAARTGDESSPLAPGGNAELMELRRFDAASIRQWMREEAHAFQSPHSQQQLLAATGGWPMLIGEVLGEGIVADPDAALDRCHRLLRDTPQALVSASGVDALPPVWAAWQALVEIDEPGAPADLAELLAPGEEAGHPLGPEALRRHHLRSIADVIEVLRMLGALIPAPGDAHELVCEPVLAGATRGEQA